MLCLESIQCSYILKSASPNDKKSRKTFANMKQKEIHEIN